MQHALQLLQAGWHAFQLVAPWLVTMFIPSVIVGLTPYPNAAEAAGILRTILNFLSVLVHSDSPGTFKPPFSMSRAPNAMPPDPTGGPSGGDAATLASMGPHITGGAVLATLFAMAMTPGCGTSAAEWKAVGIDEANCAAPAIVGALLDGLIDLLDDAAANSSPDYQQVGKQLAKKYGPTAALCAVRVAWRHFNDAPAVDGGATALKMTARAGALCPSTSRRARRIDLLEWLVHHEADWAGLPARS